MPCKTARPIFLMIMLQSLASCGRACYNVKTVGRQQVHAYSYIHALFTPCHWTQHIRSRIAAACPPSPLTGPSGRRSKSTAQPVANCLQVNTTQTILHKGTTFYFGFFCSVFLELFSCDLGVIARLGNLLSYEGEKFGTHDPLEH